MRRARPCKVGTKSTVVLSFDTLESHPCPVRRRRTNRFKERNAHFAFTLDKTRIKINVIWNLNRYLARSCRLVQSVSKRVRKDC